MRDGLWQRVCELSGILGLDVGPYTLREISWMVEARRREAWDHTASLLALIATCHRDPKKRRSGFSPQEFHPFAAAGRASARGMQVIRQTIGLLKAFVPEKQLEQLEQAKREALLSRGS